MQRATMSDEWSWTIVGLQKRDPVFFQIFEALDLYLEKG